MADFDTVILLDDIPEIVSTMEIMFAQAAAAAGIRVVSFTSDDAATRFVLQNPKAIRGFIQDIRRDEADPEAINGVLFLEQVIVPSTPWARTVVQSGHATFALATRLLDAAPGKVRLLNKGDDDNFTALRKAFSWLVESRELPNQSKDAAAAFDDRVLTALEPVWREVCREISTNPTLLHQVNPRLFEKLVAEIFRSYGYEVELTSITRDGGYDIIAVRLNAPTSTRVLIEAKRFAPDRPVGVDIIRALYGIRATNSVSQVVLATTSHVSLPARREFALVVPWQLDFLERNKILSWCRQYGAIEIGGDLSNVQGA